MTTSEAVLLDLLKHSLFQIPIEIPEFVDWEEVSQEAEEQAVLGLIYSDLPKKTETPGQEPYYLLFANFVHILVAQRELIQLLSDHGIPSAILKGSAAAIYYPEPHKRAMGDVDLIVPQECFDTATDLMRRNGYELIHEASSGGRHLAFQKDEIIFELHHHFSYEKLEFENYIIDGLKHTENASIRDYEFPMLPPLANGLVLLAHMWTHLRRGMGLRQVVDWMLYVDQVLSDDFWKTEFGPVAEKLGIDKLAITATHMCQRYLGLRENITWCQSVDKQLCDDLMEIILTYGNFGRKHRDERLVENIFSAIRREGLFRYLQHSGEKNWNAYKRHSWLKPFCWLYQIFRYGYLGIKTNRAKDLKRGIKNGNSRTDVLKQLNI